LNFCGCMKTLRKYPLNYRLLPEVTCLDLIILVGFFFGYFAFVFFYSSLSLFWLGKGGERGAIVYTEQDSLIAHCRGHFLLSWMNVHLVVVWAIAFLLQASQAEELPNCKGHQNKIDSWDVDLDRTAYTIFYSICLIRVVRADFRVIYPSHIVGATVALMDISKI
jgi:hypothetical protein